MKGCGRLAYALTCALNTGLISEHRSHYGSSQRKSWGFQEISCVLACISSHMPRDKDVYFAKLAEQAERYDEKAHPLRCGVLNVLLLLCWLLFRCEAILLFVNFLVRNFSRSVITALMAAELRGSSWTLAFKFWWYRLNVLDFRLACFVSELICIFAVAVLFFWKGRDTGLKKNGEKGRLTAWDPMLLHLLVTADMTVWCLNWQKPLDIKGVTGTYVADCPRLSLRWFGFHWQ